MKFQKLLLLSLFALIFGACEKDEVLSCTQSDWVGTYTGSVICGTVSEDATITIIASGDNAIIVKYEDSSSSTEYDPIVPSNCEIMEMNSDTTFSLTVEGFLIDDNLTITETWSTLGQTGTCEITGVRD